MVKIGDRFGRWRVVSLPHKVKRYLVVDAVCSCGKEKSVRYSSLLRGDSKSCGCLTKEVVRARVSTKGGMTKHHLYQRWYDMNRRCYDPRRKDYIHYGGRGIEVCPEWHKENSSGFYNFLNDMESSYIEKLEIDRIDNNGNYCKQNCKWSTRSEQVLNSRDLGCRVGRPHLLDDGEEVLHLAAMARKYNLDARLLQDRVVKLEMSLEDAVSMPVKTKKYFLIFGEKEYTTREVLKYPCHASNEATRLGITLHEVLYLMFGRNVRIEGIVSKQRVCFPFVDANVAGLRNIKVNPQFNEYLQEVIE